MFTIVEAECVNINMGVAEKRPYHYQRYNRTRGNYGNGETMVTTGKDWLFTNIHASISAAHHTNPHTLGRKKTTPSIL